MTLDGLYLVLTDPVAGYQACAEAAAAEGVALVQLRMKGAPREEVVRVARRLLEAVRGSATRIIVNDDPEAAAAAGADGVHLGQGDLPLSEGRRLLPGPGRLVGLSTHDEAQAAAAAALRPDYIGVGPVFATPTKRIPDPVLGVERAARIVRAAPVPAVAIGGIDPGRLPQLLAAGIRRYAVVRHVCRDREPRRAIRELIQIERSVR